MMTKATVFLVTMFMLPAAGLVKAQELKEVPQPERISSMMAARGKQDEAKPVIKIVAPAAGSTVNSSTVKVKLEISGDLKGYMPMMDPQTKMGNHIHVILDNQPYEAYYNLNREFELRNVSDGEHTIRVFPSRPWHESYKNKGAFQMVRFRVERGGADATKPTVTASGQQMAAPAEGKEMKPSTAGVVDPAKPILTFSRPKGEYKNADADAVMIDFWLVNAKLVGDGGRYKVRLTVNDGKPMLIEKWKPLWLSGWPAGKNTVKLELIDRRGNVVENGGYNSTTREFVVTR